MDNRGYNRQCRQGNRRGHQDIRHRTSCIRRRNRRKRCRKVRASEVHTLELRTKVQPPVGHRTSNQQQVLKLGSTALLGLREPE